MKKTAKNRMKKFMTTMMGLTVTASILLSAMSCQQANTSDTTNTGMEDVSQDTTGEENDNVNNIENEDDIWGEPKFPQYVLEEEDLTEPEGYQGTEHVVIGKSGYLYENGYINELYGFTQKYVQVTDGQLLTRVERLKYIQDELANREVAFCVVITPSKAASCEQFIPDFYFEKFDAPDENYVRPYLRFKDMMEEEGVYFVDSQTVYKKVGLTNVFPKTGIHWNKLAAFETCNAIIDEYMRQTGTTIRHILADSILYKSSPPGFGNPEMDIFGIVYSGKNKAVRDTAIIDDLYYWPDAYVDRSTNGKIPNMVIQGGSFTGDFYHYFESFHIVDSTTGFYYNNGGNMDIDWKNVIRRTNFVLMEVNEQFVYGMGGNAPSWGENDYRPADIGNNIIDSLYDFLVSES